MLEVSPRFSRDISKQDLATIAEHASELAQPVITFNHSAPASVSSSVITSSSIAANSPLQSAPAYSIASSAFLSNSTPGSGSGSNSGSNSANSSCNNYNNAPFSPNNTNNNNNNTNNNPQVTPQPNSPSPVPGSLRGSHDPNVSGISPLVRSTSQNGSPRSDTPTNTTEPTENGQLPTITEGITHFLTLLFIFGTYR